MGLGVLREIEARHRVGRVEERLGDGLGRLGLAHAGRAEEQERSDGAATAQAGGVAAEHARDPLHRRRVADDAIGEQRLEAEHAIAIGLEQALDRQIGELGDDVGHLRRADLRGRGGLARAARELAAGARAGEIEDGDGLVRQRAPRQVAHRPGDRRGQRLVGVVDPVVLPEAEGHALQQQERVLFAGLLDLEQAEAPRQAGVGLDRAAVLLGRRRADDPQLAPGQRDLDLGHRLVEAARSEQLVDLVDEEDHRAARVAHLGADGGDLLGERAARARAREELGDDDLHEDPRLPGLGDRGEALGEAAHDRRLAHAGRADEAGAVGVPLGEHVEDLIDLGLAPDDLVELPFGRREREVVPDRRERGEDRAIEGEARERGLGDARPARRRRRRGAWRRCASAERGPASVWRARSAWAQAAARTAQAARAALRDRDEARAAAGRARR